MKYENPILNEREATHGDYAHTAEAAQVIKRQIRATLHKAGVKLSTMQSESLDQIATKIARICSGNPDDPEHWRDISGYADLISGRLRPGASPGKILPIPQPGHALLDNRVALGSSPEGTSA